MDKVHNTIILDQEYSDTSTQRTIIDLIDVETGEFVDAAILDNKTEAELTSLQELQDLSRKSGIYKYVCAICGQPLRLDSRKFASKRSKSYFFSHYSYGNDCPLKKSSDALDPIRSTIKLYGRFKEGELHKKMRQALMNVLSIDKRFSNVESYPTISIYGEKVHWHKPDVASLFYGNQLVFETLIYNTFLSNIVDKDSFYRMANSFLLWLFPYFSFDDQIMCEKNVYYTHRRNIFVFDSEDYYRAQSDDICAPKKPVFAEQGYRYAQEESLRQGRLMLNCYWQVPIVKNDQVKIEWHYKLVDIQELTFDAIRKDVYFHNSDYDFKEVADSRKRELIESWERAKEDRWSQIYQRIQERKEVLENKNSKKNVLSRILSGEIVPELFKEGDKYGYKADGIVIIKSQYAKASQFRDGIALVVNKKKKYGIINFKNEPVIDIKYENITWLDQGRTILICSEGKYGPFSLYFTSGRKVVDHTLKAINKVNGNYIFIESLTGKVGLISAEGKVLLDLLYDDIVAEGEDKYRLSYAGSTKVINALIEENKTNICTEILPGKFIGERSLSYGIVDGEGNTLLPFEYSKIERYSDQFISIEQWKNNSVHHGLLDNSLEMALPLSPLKMTILQNGSIVRGCTLYNTQFKELVKGFAFLELCPNGKYIIGYTYSLDAYRNVRYYGIIDDEGKTLFPCIAPQVVKDSEGNVAFEIKHLKNNRKAISCFGIYVLATLNGDFLTDRAYTQMMELPDGNLLVKWKEKLGVINKDGNHIVECIYDSIDLTENGDVRILNTPLDAYCQKSCYIEKYALSDFNGQRLTEYIYDEIECWYEGVYIATNSTCRHIIDRTGRVVYTPSDSTQIAPLGDRYILLKVQSQDEISDSYGVVDLEGREIVPTEFSYIELLPNKKIKVAKQFYSKYKYGIYNTDGILIIPPIFTEVHWLPNETWKVKSENEKFGIFSENGKVIYECKYQDLHTDELGNLIPSFYRLNDDVCVARLFDKFALASIDESLLTDYVYDEITHADNNYYRVKSNNNNGVIDSLGKVLLPLSDYEVIEVIDTDRFIVARNGNQSLVDGRGIFLTHKAYSVVRRFCKGLSVIPNVVYPDPAELENPCSELPQANGFKVITRIDLQPNHNCINVDKDSTLNLQSEVLYIGKYYTNSLEQSVEMYDFIDKDGNVVCATNEKVILNDDSQLTVTSVISYCDTTVKKFLGKYAICKNNGSPVCYFVYDTVKDLTEYLFIVGQGNNYGLVDMDGKCILPLEYSSKFELCSNGVIKFAKKTQSGQLFGLCHSNGKKILEPTCTFIRENKPGCFKLFYNVNEGQEQKTRFLNLTKNKEFVVGETYMGIVRVIKEYGVFLNVPGIGSGLLHINRIKKLGKDISNFYDGEKLFVKVLRIREDGKVEFDIRH